VPLLRNFERVLRGVLAVATLHLFGKAPVKTHLARRIERAVEGVANERVGKIVDLALARRPQQLRLECRI